MISLAYELTRDKLTRQWHIDNTCLVSLSACFLLAGYFKQFDNLV